ncbi:MAG TPA: transposase [Cytophagales bacterium]|nr:transposase [Cytophagales bacterium]HAA18463.1 transposase [Cytophagales bacterium]HAP61063.1 transposase [Cytophagales bacterium]
MSNAYKFRDESQPYFVSFSTIRWMDIFTRRHYKDIVVDSLQHCIDNKGLILHAWVIMTNHVHLAMASGKEPMHGILRDMKSYTSKRLYEAINDNPQESRRDWLCYMIEREGSYNPQNVRIQIWQQGNHPIELSSAYLMQQKVDYIHRNPVEAGFVHEPEHYLYSSAFDYAGGKGMLPVVLAF